MYYHRGLHVRPDHEGFKLGVHKAQKAIENAIGSSLGFPKKMISGKVSVRSGTSDKCNVTEQEIGSKNIALQFHIFIMKYVWHQMYLVCLYSV